MKPRRDKSSTSKKPVGETVPPVGVRIIGGSFRGRRLEYSGDPRTRPMKDRVREAAFNLIGPAVRGKHAIDLFAGTGALGLEALSRGAARATFIEQHFPTARAIRRNAEVLGAENLVEIATANTFLWFRRRPDLGSTPWLVFCSPPYRFYVERAGEMLALIGGLIESGPEGSIFVVESDEGFDPSQLPMPEQWDVRVYPPAVIGIYVKQRVAETSRCLTGPVPPAT